LGRATNRKIGEIFCDLPLPKDLPEDPWRVTEKREDGGRTTKQKQATHKQSKQQATHKQSKLAATKASN
jgi:hypothetical protein